MHCHHKTKLTEISDNFIIVISKPGKCLKGLKISSKHKWLDGSSKSNGNSFIKKSGKPGLTSPPKPLNKPWEVHAVVSVNHNWFILHIEFGYWRGNRNKEFIVP